MKFVRLFAVLSLISACSAELPHESPFDTRSPLVKQAKASLSGNVVLEGETDFSQVTVELLNESRTYSVDTDESGRVQLTGVVPGTYRLSLRTRYFTPVSEAVTIDLAEVHDLGTRQLNLRRGKVFGSAVAERLEGSALLQKGGVTVRLMRTASIRSEAAAGASKAFRQMAEATTATVYSTLSAPNGEFQFNEVPAGRYEVVASENGENERKVGTAAVTADGDLQLEEIVLRPLTGFFDIVGRKLDGTLGDTRYTQRSDVQLRLTESNAHEVVIVQSSDGTTAGCNFSGAAKQPIAGTVDHVLTGAEGEKLLCLKYIDAEGNETQPLYGSIVFDATPPGPVSIRPAASGGYVKTPFVIIDLSAVDEVSGVRQLAIDAGTPQPYQPTMQIPLSSEGVTTKSLRIIDAAGNSTDPFAVTVTVDTQLPALPTLDIVDGNGTPITQTRHTLVQLATGASDPVPSSGLEMMVSNRSDFAGAAWIPYSSQLAWELPAAFTAAGENRTVYVLVRDRAGNVRGPVNDSVLLDSIGPTSPSISMSSALVSAPTVNVTLGASDAAYIELSEDIGFLNPTVLAYTTATTYTFSNSADGAKNLYARFVDDAGNYSSIVQAATVLDMTAPENPGLTIIQASPTKEATLNLQLSASGAVQMSVSEGACVENWESYAQTKAHVLSSNTPGTYTIAAWYRDAAGNRTACLTRNITFDNLAPELLTTPLQINYGAPSTSSNVVLLSFNAAGATEVQVSEDVSFADALWQPYTTTRTFTLSPGNGTKTVHVRFRDPADNQTVTVSQSIVLDTSPITAPFINIQADVTSATTVNVQLSASNAVEVKLSELADLSDVPAWEPYAANKSFTFTGTDGAKRLYAKFRKASLAESEIVSDTYVLDRAAPSYSSLTINNGVGYTDGNQVTLGLTAVDGTSGVQWMVVSENADFSGASEQNYVPALVYPLGAGEGSKTVYVRYGDRAKNFASAVQATITVDTLAPSVSLLQVEDAGGAALTTSNNARVVVHLAATDANPLQMLVSNRSDFAGSTWQPYQEFLQWDLPLPTNPNGESRTVYAKVRDAAGHEVNAGNWTLTLDTLAPTGSADIVPEATNSLTVDISFVYANADRIEISPDAGFQSKLSFSARATTTYTFAGGDGAKTLYARFLDDAGNVSATTADQVVLDTTAPQLAAFTIEQGAITNQLSINLSLTALDASEMQIGEDTCSASWVPYAQSVGHTFASSVEGVKTVAVRFRDAAGNMTACLTKTIELDQAGPAFMATPVVSINDGAAYTRQYSAGVTFSVSGATQMQVSESAAFVGAAWEAYAASKNWTFGPGEGTKTLYARFRDDANNITGSLSSTIDVDTMPPAFNAFQGPSTVPDADVTVGLTASGAASMRISEDPAFSSAAWTVYAATTTYTLTAGEGLKTLYAQLADEAGNESMVRSIQVTVDQSAPEAPLVTILSGAFTKSAAVTVQILADNAAEMQLSELADFSDTTWGPYASTKSFAVTGGDGAKTIYARVRDAAGNESAASQATVTLDATAPAVSIFRAEDGSNNIITETSSLRYFLRLSVSDASPLTVQFAPTNVFGTAVSEAVQELRAWDVAAPADPDGENRTTYARIVDAAGNATVVGPVTVLVDSVAPSAASMSFSAAMVSSPTVNVTLSANNATFVELSEDIGFLSPTVVVYTTNTTHGFSNTADGVKTLYARFVDDLGNYSAIIQASAVLDTTPPENVALTIVQTSPTKETTLNLQLTASGATQMSISEGACTENWESYAQTKAHVLSGSTPGTYTIAVRYRDAVDNRSACLTQNIVLDNEVPQLLATPFQINGGEAQTSQPQVNLSFNVSGASELRVSTDNSFSDVTWIPYVSSRDFVLSGADGSKMIYVQFRDAADNQTAVLDQTIELDTAPPAISIVDLNSGASYASGLGIALTVAASGDPVQMNIRDEAGDLYNGPFAAVTTVTLSPGVGLRTLSVKLWDAAANGSERISRSIIVDTDDPRGTIQIANGAAKVPGELVSLNLTAVDDGSGIRGIKLANESSALLSGASEVSFDATKSWTLAAVAGGSEALRTVWYQAFDKAGNAASPVSASVVVDKLAPTGSISFDTAVTNETLVALNLSYASGTTQMKLSGGNACAGGNWVDASTSSLWTLVDLDGPQQVSVRFRDQAGNESSCYNATVTLDTTGPTPTQFDVTGNAAATPGYTNTVNLTVDAAASDTTCTWEIAEDMTFAAPTDTGSGCTLSSLPYTIANQVDGQHFFYVQFYDALGNAGPMRQATIVLDRTLPSVIGGGFTIDEGAYTKSTTIHLSHSVAGVAEMAVAEGASCGSSFTAYSASSIFTLSGTQGAKTVRVQYRDLSGNITGCLSQSVTYDSVAPTFTSVSLTGAEAIAGRTANQVVTVALNGVAGSPAEMRVANLSGFPGTPWQTYAAGFSWQLASGDGSKDVYVQLRDAAGNESVVRTGAIVLDQTPPDPPALQLTDLDDDGYAVTSTTIELSWTQPGATNFYELQRYIHGFDSDFTTIQGSLAAAVVSYTDTTDKPGTTHQYRIRARDDLNNTSNWSLVVVAQPYMAVTDSVWIKAEDRYYMQFAPQTGVFQLDSAYEWTDPNHADFSAVLGTNVVDWVRPDVSEVRLNEGVTIRQRNADNSLLYDTSVPLPLNMFTDIGVINKVSGSYGSIVLTDGMQPAIFFDRNTMPLSIRQVTLVNGAPVEEVLGTGSVLSIDAAVDPMGNPVVAYRPSSATEARIASKVVLSDSFEHSRSTGNWPVVAGTSAVSTGARNEPQGSSALLLSGAGAYVQSFSLTAYGELQYRYYWQPGGTNNSGGAPEISDYLRFQYTTDGSTWTTLQQHSGTGAKDTEFKEATGTVPATAIAVRFINNGSLASDQFFIDSVELKSSSWIVQTALAAADNVGNRTKIAVDGDGIPHIVHRDATNQRILWTRRSAGAWTTEAIDITGNNGETFDFLIDPAGKLHVAYYDDDTNKQVKYATNASGVWAFDVIESNNSNYPGLRGVGITRDSTGTLHIAYGAQNTWTGLRWTNGSKGSWSAPVQITTTEPLWNAKRIEMTADRYPRVLFKSAIGLDPVLLTYDGATWTSTNLYVPGDAGYGLDMAQDRLGNAHVTFGNITRGEHAYMKVNLDTTPHWTEGTHGTGGASNVGRGVDVAIDRFGGRHMVYYDGGGSQYVKPDGSRESIGLTGSIQLALAVDDNGAAHVSVQNGGALTYLTNKTGVWVPTVLDNSVALTGYKSDIAVDAAGVAHISYVDWTNSRAMYINSAAAVPVIVNSTIDRNGKTSIGVDSQGFVHMTFGRTGRIGYAHNQSGTMTEQLLPTNNTQSSRDSSLAIDSQDRVHVLVHAWTQNDVYYAVLKDGAWTAQWIEQFPDVGKPVALALDASGRPFATYKDKGAALNRLAVLKDDGTWLLSTLIPGCDGDESHGIAIAADRWDIMTAACHIPTGGIQWTTGQFFGPIQGITSSLPAPF